MFYPWEDPDTPGENIIRYRKDLQMFKYTKKGLSAAQQGIKPKTQYYQMYPHVKLTMKLKKLGFELAWTFSSEKLLKVL